jgi:ribosomal protein L40E
MRQFSQAYGLARRCLAVWHAAYPSAMAAKGKARRRVCDKCGTLNTARAKACAKCGGHRFAPGWVRQLRRVNKQFAVQVADPHPLSESSNPVLKLYKWWPGGNANFNIPTAQQWEAVRRIVETELAPFLGWTTAATAAKAAKTAAKADRHTQAQLAALTGDDPKAIAKLIGNLNLADANPEELPRLGEAIAEIAAVLVGMDEDRLRAIEKIIKKLPERARRH